MTISACWIAKDEAANLGRSIESVREAVDELVVVDTGSVDHTVEVAEACGARVERFAWTQDFSEARNFALSEATGEVVVFLDADEWFAPALTKKDRARLEETFARNPALEALQLPLRDLDEAGNPAELVYADRVLRRRPGLAYRGRVHERYAHADGTGSRSARADCWTLLHSGYAGRLQAEKAERNIGLLERAVRETGEGDERVLQLCYLVREYGSRGDAANAVRCLKEALRFPGAIPRLCREYGDGFIPLLYVLIEAAARGGVAPDEIREKLAGPFAEQYPRYPGAATVRLYADALCGRNEDKLAGELEQALAGPAEIPEGAYPGYRAVEAWLYRRAVFAAHRQGEAALAERCALSAAEREVSRDPETLRILLICLRGRETAKIVERIDGLYPGQDAETARFLALGSRVHGCNGVHLHYMKRWMDTGELGSSNHLYLLLSGRYRESVLSARLTLSADPQALARHLFLTAACSGDKRIYLENKARLGPYARLLEAFFTGNPLNRFSRQDLEMYAGAYEMVAFLAGRETADRLGTAFAGMRGFLERVRAAYRGKNGLRP